MERTLVRNAFALGHQCASPHPSSYLSSGLSAGVSNFCTKTRHYHSRVESTAAQQRLFFDVLSANATKRDAKQYLATFGHQRESTLIGEPPKSGSLKEITRQSASEADLLTRRRDSAGLHHAAEGKLSAHGVRQTEAPAFEQIHSALLCFKSPESVDDMTLDGLAVTLSQLSKLGLRPIVVLDPSLPQRLPGDEGKFKSLRTILEHQAWRLGRAIERHSSEGAQFLTSILEWAGPDMDDGALTGANPLVVSSPDLLLRPLKRGVVPIIPCMAYTSSAKLLHAPSVDVMNALTASVSLTDTSHTRTGQKSISDVMCIERVIVLDNIGGIPNGDDGSRRHVLINLETEFDRIRQDLTTTEDEATCSNPSPSSAPQQHLNNLGIVRSCLEHLPSSTSGLIITPHEASNTSGALFTDHSIAWQHIGRNQNTLVHNLLTNRPSVSSSLPAARLPSIRIGPGDASTTTPRAATLIKRGMPLNIIPGADRIRGWQKPVDGYTNISLQDDSEIDFSQLVHLINDSFRRKLAVDDYIARIRGRVAGVIVVGEYEGAAVFTWEMPPSTQDSSRLVPYLDKFAVRQSSQGSSGVADQLFQTMVGTCFPHGVCWRSKKSNPANKWYFERSSGSWQIPASDWTMFWTGDAFTVDRKWEDYLEVCRSIQPTWEGINEFRCKKKTRK